MSAWLLGAWVAGVAALLIRHRADVLCWRGMMLAAVWPALVVGFGDAHLWQRED